MCVFPGPGVVYVVSIMATGTSTSDPCADIDSSKQSQGERGISFMRYLFAEVSHGYLLEEDEQLYSEKQRRVTTFMKTPRELEKLMLFGFFVCLDAFLFVFTFLPLRVLTALLTCFFRIMSCSRWWLDPAHKCDLMRASILLLCTIGMTYVDTSALYHVVRGQSVIKLYVIYNMLEIFDRLLASIGQDTLDALYWVASESRRRKEQFETLLYFIVAIFYVFIHANVVLAQAVTLNVAINSYNKALLTIMVSNNFVELKGSVFKKFETNNLFQMSCSDIRERFHYLILLMIVCVRNGAQLDWDPAHLEPMLPVVVMVFASEIFVDWIKHAFITKFNDISPDVYRKYRAILSHDLATSRHKNARSDHSDLVSRRMGFIPLPLGCLVWQTLSQSLSLPVVTGSILLVVIFFCLTSLKVLIGIVLLGKACKYHSSEPTQSNEQSSHLIGQQSHVAKEEGVHRRTSSHVSREQSSKSAQGSKSRAKPLEDVERYTLCSNRIV